MNPFEFLDEFFITKTRVPGLSVGEDSWALTRGTQLTAGPLRVRWADLFVARRGAAPRLRWADGRTDTHTDTRQTPASQSDSTQL